MTPAEIVSLRQALNLSQVELAARLGVSPASVHRWETGKTEPTPLAMRQLNKLVKKTTKKEVR